ncbi:MAG: type I DNA topoisomerase [Vampirovibrionales bacterium]|nr:type I DNA topoisomerase [Vampirovibrionales bacterium]
MPPAKPKKTAPKKTSAKAGATSKTKSTAAKTKTTASGSKRTEGLINNAGKNLVIVESPAKAKTIKKILGEDFFIKASVGHIRDLPEKKLGVDVTSNFEPTYEVMSKKADVVADLRSAAKQAKNIFLAPDPDREGEAIAWHIAALLDVPEDKIKRVVFNEITKTAVQEAIAHPRSIDMGRVNAQQARRILDRLVGYKLSPLLWKKVTKGLSAGRVQSVAVRLVCEREAEIEAFTPQEYWRIHADLAEAGKQAPTWEAEVAKIDGKKAELPNEAKTNEILNRIKASEPLKITNVTERQSSRNPAPPFITSTLQRDASNKMGYPVKRTMQIAQKLYEGIALGKEGPVGLITYMRTDSVRIADEAMAEAQEFIKKQFGDEFYPEKPRYYAQKGKAQKEAAVKAQDAHEAIRPTSVWRTPQSLRNDLNDEQFKLYSLIWNRFVASQMAAARMQTRGFELDAQGVLLRLSHTDVLFPGFLKVYRADDPDDKKPKNNDDNDEADDEASAGKPMPPFKKGDSVTLAALRPKQHFTEPPPRYNEASLVKMMEELGIGRPSTYAATIATIQDRTYVLKEEKALKPTELGKTVTQLLMKHFDSIVDTHFTANMENKLDAIADENLPWQDVLRDFYEPFEATLKKANTEMEKVQIIMPGAVCTEEGCGKPMALKTSRWGSQFLGCTGYPDCKGTQPLTKDLKPVEPDKPSDEKCEKCGGAMVIKSGRFGLYLKCTEEACKANQPLVQKTGVSCPDCKKANRTGDIIQRRSQKGKIFYGCNQYPECKYVLWQKPTNKPCEKCGGLTMEKVLKKGTFLVCADKDNCGQVTEVPETPETAGVA